MALEPAGVWALDLASALFVCDRERDANGYASDSPRQLVHPLFSFP
jgi:hypothetical protein